MALSTLSPLEAALIDTVRVALNSSPSALRQQVRQLCRKTPDSPNAVELKAQLTALLAAAPPDAAGILRRTAPADALPAPKPPVVRSTHGAPGDAATRTAPPRVPESPSLVLAASTEAVLKGIVAQHSSKDLLLSHGVSPANKVLFIGPPGVGKTLSAAYLAAQLEMPMTLIDPTTVISSFLGSSARNLRELLHGAQGLVFLDEFDALAKTRTDEQEIGEVKRLVNSLLLELDQHQDGLLVAATNHQTVLDAAIVRRFDVTVTFSLPSLEERQRLIQTHSAVRSGLFAREECDLVALLTEGRPHSDVQREVSAISREALLTGLNGAGMSDILARWASEFFGSKDVQPHTRRMAAKMAVETLGWSNRKTASVLGVSHPTIGKWLEE